MPKSNPFFSRGLRYGLPNRFREYLTYGAVARFHQNAHPVRESGHSRHILKHGQNARSGKCSGYRASTARLIIVQTSLTQKLVPLLSKIRTKEPAVTVRFGSPYLL